MRPVFASVTVRQCCYFGAMISLHLSTQTQKQVLGFWQLGIWVECLLNPPVTEENWRPIGGTSGASPLLHFPERQSMRHFLISFLFLMKYDAVPLSPPVHGARLKEH